MERTVSASRILLAAHNPYAVLRSLNALVPFEEIEKAWFLQLMREIERGYYHIRKSYQPSVVAHYAKVLLIVLNIRATSYIPLHTYY
jgi:hypothetical protein